MLRRVLLECRDGNPVDPWAPLLGAPPIAPTEDEWRAVTPAEREPFLVKVLDALSDRRSTMKELEMGDHRGRPGAICALAAGPRRC